MNTLLNTAKNKFKKGDLFLSATGNIKAPLVVNNLLVAQNYPSTIVNENGGVIVFTDEITGELVWAKEIVK